MSNTVNQTLRMPQPLAAALDALAGEEGLSRHQLILNVLDEFVASDFSPGLILGYVEVTGGEIEDENDCPECGQPFGQGKIFIGFIAGHIRPQLFGPVCKRCARLEE